MTVGALIFEHNCGSVGILLQEFYKYKFYIQKLSIPTPPPHNGQSKFLGGGGLKGRNFRRVSGVPTRRILHRVVKDTIDRMSHTWIIFICSTTTTRNRCPFKKKLKRYLSQMSSSLLGVRYVSL